MQTKIGAREIPNDQTFFVVVEAPQLLALRQQIAAAFVAKGGKPSAFNAANYHPHITVGFTSADIQEEQGLVKDAKSIPNPLGLIVDPK